MWLLLAGLPHAAPAPPDVGGLPSPSGRHTVVLRDDQLVWGGGDPPVTVPPPLRGPLRGLVAWVDERRVYVGVLDVESAGSEAGPAEPRCGVYDRRTGTWTEPKECVTGAFWSVHAVQLHDGVAIVGSSGEGHPALDVYRWTPEAGRGVDLFPPIDLYPFGPVEAAFTSVGVVLSTPCDLTRPHPCLADDGLPVEGPVRTWRRRGGRWVPADPLSPGP